MSYIGRETRRLLQNTAAQWISLGKAMDGPGCNAFVHAGAVAQITRQKYINYYTTRKSQKNIRLPRRNILLRLFIYVLLISLIIFISSNAIFASSYPQIGPEAVMNQYVIDDRCHEKIMSESEISHFEHIGFRDNNRSILDPDCVKESSNFKNPELNWYVHTARQFAAAGWIAPYKDIPKNALQSPYFEVSFLSGLILWRRGDTVMAGKYIFRSVELGFSDAITVLETVGNSKANY
ncbi:hypothetical protein L6Q21_14175 [Sandaracinobacter sp. RS1-74]|uniref:hypothetical protein n=1 Tax=Sandaracinobacteroides sayramensis TaxID=2913411 RepID=UPI001EDB50F6|nr:hypothetical protein [Sandaracinobacteroides sayramensis]MCG2842132.1 hypothetical protein [Sandaracinobacteroides sayramensis]